MSTLIQLVWALFYWPLVISIGIGVLMIPVGIVWFAVSSFIYRNK